MERDFEKEFKELKQNEEPDLWNRIEAGLTPKAVASNAQTETGRMPRVHRWALVIAACLCMLITVPVLSLMRSNSSSSGMPADMSGGTEASAEDGDWSAIGEAAAVASEATESTGIDMNGYADGVSDSVRDIDAGVDESVKENMMEDSLTNGLESSKSGSFSGADIFSDDSDMGNGVKKELQRIEASRYDASNKKTTDADNTVDWNSVLQEGQLLNAVKIRVLEIDQTGNADDVYTVRAVIVSSDEDNYLSEYMELMLLCNTETAYDFARTPREKASLQTGETYTVNLRYEGNGAFAVMKAVK